MQEVIEQLTGQWSGQKVLFTSWLDVKEHKSICSCTWRPILNATALQLSYTWRYQQEDQQGELLLAFDADQQLFSAAWLDSWHQARSPMLLKGKQVAGVIQLTGTFSAGPDEPDWGWRISIFPVAAGKGRLEMYVQPPPGQGEESVAVIIEAS